MRIAFLFTLLAVSVMSLPLQAQVEEEACLILASDNRGEEGVIYVSDDGETMEVLLSLPELAIEEAATISYRVQRMGGQDIDVEPAAGDPTLVRPSSVRSEEMIRTNIEREHTVTFSKSGHASYIFNGSRAEGDCRGEQEDELRSVQEESAEAADHERREFSDPDELIQRIDQLEGQISALERQQGKQEVIIKENTYDGDSARNAFLGSFVTVTAIYTIAGAADDDRTTLSTADWMLAGITNGFISGSFSSAGWGLDASGLKRLGVFQTVVFSLLPVVILLEAD